MKARADKFSFSTASAVIIANMIGTGVFTTLGYQLLEIKSGFVLLALWAIGGLAALCGAMSYAELGAALPRSGGEYHFLSRIYHPAAGFVSGWVSATIGFAAPTAAVAITFAAYISAALPGTLPSWFGKGLACALVLGLSAIHASNRRNSSGLQLGFTSLKIVLILAFCGASLWAVQNPQPISFLPQAGDGGLIASGTFAVALIYVSYAYTGWNAATYLSSELEEPQRTLPRVLLAGTALVSVLYLLLNFVFLRVAPINAMEGQLEIGYISAQYAFGEGGARFVGGMLALLLVSTVSAMTLAGPRALQVLGEDYPALGALGKVNRHGVPANAIYVQAGVALLFILTSTFQTLLIFAGSMLAFNSLLAVLGVFVLRWREPGLARPYRTFLFPLPPLIYLALTTFTLVFVLRDNPMTGLFGAGVIGVGLVFYFISRKRP